METRVSAWSCEAGGEVGGVFEEAEARLLVYG